MVIIADVCRTREHNVFEQMGEAGALHFFIFRADVVHDYHGRDGRRMIFVQDHGQAVRQCVLLELNIDLCKCHCAHGNYQYEYVTNESHWSYPPIRSLENCGLEWKESKDIWNKMQTAFFSIFRVKIHLSIKETHQ